jgi:NADH-quinone oxidoreductase subunit I
VLAARADAPMARVAGFAPLSLTLEVVGDIHRRSFAFLRMTAALGTRQASYTGHMSIVRNIAGVAKGMSITFGEMFKPTEVENYPDGPGPNRGAHFQDRFRGAHVLQRDENGLEKCVACFLCAAACPANCIYIEAADNTEEKRISSAERYAKVYNIDYNRCIFCGYCVEACPTDAITHGHGFELATLNATNLIYRKEDMLVPQIALPGATQAQSDSIK